MNESGCLALRMIPGETENTPVELQDDITKINSILGSLQSHVQATATSGANPLVEQNNVK
ncbi:hypothetical protein [Ammoniphilus sp. 3BR4]|uniref:hypothetical protein n=1 Tax=Ammoniphilus sp. 3BR4 TaxID=3158265 RepID=UPI003466928D